MITLRHIENFNSDDGSASMNCWNSGEKKSRVVVHLFDSFSDKIR
jgi:hypothetical protein